MKSNKILVVYSSKKTEKHFKALEEVNKILKQNTKEQTSIKLSDLNENYFKNKDLIITLGGDGTFLGTSHFIREKPILGINSEPELSEGALTSLNSNELTDLEKILKGDYKTIQRPRARVLKNNQLIKELALNEVYVGAANQFHTSRYIIRINGDEEEHRSSGVLVVTGSGSKAWYKSAGGSPFNYNKGVLAYLVREPYKSRIFNPKIINGYINKNERIEFESKRIDGGVIAIDSNSTYDFNLGDVIDIRLSEQPLNIITKNENPNTN